MTFLPIVDRELRVAARRRGTYWTRLGLGLAATCIGTGIVIFTSNLLAPTQVGQFVFRGLSGLLLMYCLAYGRRATADCLSMEKREGTLGLLFLTDLKGHDIVLGKLAATSLGGLYALLGVLPVLSLCLLLGGVTAGEFWRMVLVLLDTFLLSLSVGMLGSALTREFRYAMAVNFFLLLLFVLFIPAATAGVSYLIASNPTFGLFSTSPIYAFLLSFALPYSAMKAEFWRSVGVMQGLSWLLILLAGRLVLRSRQERVIKSKGARWREFWHAWSYGRAAHRPAFRKQLLDINAFYWLAARARLKPVHVWIFLAAMAGYWVSGRFLEGEMWFDQDVFIAIALMLNLMMKTWIVIEAGNELADDQKSGAVELLLSVPLTVEDILKGQILALRRQFLKPLLVVIGIALLFMAVSYVRSGKTQVVVMWPAAIVMLVLDVVALVGLAMLRALKTRNHNVATIGTILRLLVLPWALFGIVIATGRLWYAFTPPFDWTPGWKFCLSLWFGLGVAADLLFGITAWWQLKNQFRQIALQRFDPPSSRFVRRPGRQRPVLASAGASKVVDSPTQEPEEKRPPRRRVPRAALVAALVLLLLGGVWIARLLRPGYPPPVIVPLKSHQTSLQVFPGQGGALIVLPDRSLWRWGQTDGGSSPRARVPQQVGTNYDWVEAASSGNHCVGIRTNGTLWEWGAIGLHVGSEPSQVGFGGGWKKAVVSTPSITALRQDGTLWQWGYESGTGRPLTNIYQIGTNSDWTDLCGNVVGTFGLRKDSTLWVWNPLLMPIPYVVRYGIRHGPAGAPTAGPSSVIQSLPPPPRLTQPTFDPTRVGLGAKWAGFAGSFGNHVQVWNSSGQLWDFAAFYQASAGAYATVVLPNSASGRAILAFTGVLRIFSVHVDGTLWAKDYSWQSGPIPARGDWQRVGKRSDWVSLWSGHGTAFGLTADGTLWTWGPDPSEDPMTSFAARLRVAQLGLRSLFAPRSPGRWQPGINYPCQTQPRPLLRLVSGNEAVKN